MKNILFQNTKNITVIDECSDDNKTEYEKMHENILGCQHDELSSFGIGNYTETLLIPIDNDFKNLYLKSDLGLIFSFIKMTNSSHKI